jgi:hypothetical protein
MASCSWARRSPGPGREGLPARFECWHGSRRACRQQRRLRRLPWQASGVPHRGRPGRQRRGIREELAAAAAGPGARNGVSHFFRATVDIPGWPGSWRRQPRVRHRRSPVRAGPLPRTLRMCDHGLKVIHLRLHGLPWSAFHGGHRPGRCRQPGEPGFPPACASAAVTGSNWRCTPSPCQRRRVPCVTSRFIRRQPSGCRTAGHRYWPAVRHQGVTRQALLLDVEQALVDEFVDAEGA